MSTLLLLKARETDDPPDEQRVQLQRTSERLYRGPARARVVGEQEVRSYYPRLLSHLEESFGLRLSFDATEDFNKKVLFSLFQDTTLSYRDLRHPWSNYQEATLIIRKLEDAGTSGQRILHLSDKIREKTKDSAELHLQMLYELFQCIYGPINIVVTSQQLLAMGFDDSKEPKWWDFED